MDGGVDMLICETIFDTMNSKAAVYAINESRAELTSCIVFLERAFLDEVFVVPARRGVLFLKTVMMFGSVSF